MARLLDRGGAWSDSQELNDAAGTAEEWAALDKEDLLILLRGMFRAKNKLLAGRFWDSADQRRAFLAGPLGGARSFNAQIC